MAPLDLLVVSGWAKKGVGCGVHIYSPETMRYRGNLVPNFPHRYANHRQDCFIL